MKRLLLVSCMLIVGLSLTAGTLPAAETYPDKPITLVVPLGPGGMTDVTARMLVEKFKAELGQPVLVVNKPGANGVVGLKYALGQKPDGYTVIISPLTDNLASPYFQDEKPFDLNEFSYVGSYMPQERVLFAPPDKPYKTFKEFIDYVRKNPGQVSVGAGGVQWPLEVMKSIAVKEKLQMKYVMFKSGGEASTAILGKHVDVCETGTGTAAYQAAREGKLNLIVDLGADKVPFFPDAKNLKELGYPFTTVVEYGLALKAGTPEPIRKKLEDALRKAMADKEIQDTMLKMGLTPRFLDGKAFQKLVTEAVGSVAELIKYNKALPQ